MGVTSVVLFSKNYGAILGSDEDETEPLLTKVSALANR